MILDRYIFKELFKSQFVVLLVLISIFAAQSLIRLVTDAASGDMPAGLIIKFLLFSLPEFLGLLLPLTLYVSIIITLGRICSDSEMVVMRAVGFSPKRIMTVALMLALLAASGAGYISLVLTPQAALAMQELEVQATKNPEFLPIDSGRFVSFGKYNIYVEQVDSGSASNKQVENVYVIDSENPSELSITVASKGHILVDDEGVRWLVLNDGRRYENPADGSYRMGNFTQFRAPLSGNITEANAKGSKLSTLSSYELFLSDDIKAQVELQWRLAPVFAVLVMCMVAVPLSMVNPRQGRFTRLMPAIIIYVAYYLFLLSLRNMVITGAMPLYPGLFLVPICFFLLVAIPLNMPKTYIKQRLGCNKKSRNKGKDSKASHESESNKGSKAIEASKDSSASLVNSESLESAKDLQEALASDLPSESIVEQTSEQDLLASSKVHRRARDIAKNQQFASELEAQKQPHSHVKQSLQDSSGSLQVNETSEQELKIESLDTVEKASQGRVGSGKSEQDGE